MVFVPAKELSFSFATDRLFLDFLYFYRLEYTRQDNSKKQEMGVDGPSPDLRVRVSVIFTLTKISLDGSSAVKTLLAPCVLGILQGGP